MQSSRLTSAQSRLLTRAALLASVTNLAW